ncbi:DsbA family protein [Luteococcus sp. Sow4_B9]|uniref:DsbA family protein n=1 Tax=Luteococcus sp. Sow4_B9 TaxID=3438792 RepID=UPI003F9DD0F0
MSKKKSTGASAANGSASRREMLRQQQEAEAKRQKTMKAIGIAAAVLALALVAVVATVLIRDRQAKTEQLSGAGRPVNAATDNTGIVMNPGKAKEGAPVLEVYQDYQCPYCKSVAGALAPLLDPLVEKGEVSLEYRTMTFMESNLLNDDSTKSAVAAACADNAGAYKAFHDAIYEKQPKTETRGEDAYPDALLRDQLPQQVGITGDKLTAFQKCFDDKTTEAFVETVNTKAAEANVDSTPTYRVNGKDLDLQTIGQSSESLLEAIKKLAAS